MSALICEAEWAFDVDFDVMCAREPNHPGKHAAVVEGNRGVWARIEWEDLVELGPTGKAALG